jgi:hypothetical protein
MALQWTKGKKEERKAISAAAMGLSDLFRYMPVVFDWSCNNNA